MTQTSAPPLPDVLTSEHRRQIEDESAIPADLIAEEGIRSLDGSHQLPVPAETFRHPNSYKGQLFPSWPDLGPGILFPISTAYGGLTYQYKADAPRVRKKQNGDDQVVKYETCGGSRLALHVPRRVR